MESQQPRSRAGLGKGRSAGSIAAYERAGTKTAKQNKDEIGKARFINENPAKDRKVQARLKEVLEREGIDKEVLIKAILRAKPGLDQQVLSQKMNWWVDANGQQLEPNDKGEFPEGSIPYAVFAARNPKVKEAYGDLHPATDLNLL
jgi:hypothetical protein